MTTGLDNISMYSRFNLRESLSDTQVFIKEYRERVQYQLDWQEDAHKTLFKSFAEKRLTDVDYTWLGENDKRFLENTGNGFSAKQDYLCDCGFICCMLYSEDGDTVIVGHASGLIQMRHGYTGIVMCTLRNIQFPPKPIYALEYSKMETNVCYAACMDGVVYRIEIPQLNISCEDPPQFCIRSDPALECLNMQFFGAPGIASHATPFVSLRASAQSLSLTADQCKLVVGYGDNSIKVYDVETKEADLTYKVHKLRLQFIPKKLQRMHFGKVCALKCHPQRPCTFASGGWDKTLRVWDTRCKVGCVMTFEGVDICSDSIDINDSSMMNPLQHVFRLYTRHPQELKRVQQSLHDTHTDRDHVLAGSWRPTEAVTIWDLTARKRLCIVRVQNRRPDVDGEYVYACKYWHSTKFNRKGKYAIIGGSGTKCVEIINLHNRYISCSYPASGTVLAITSHEERIAFGGTSTTFNIVKFHDPKHEKEMYYKEDEPEFDYTKEVNIYDDSELDRVSATSTEMPQNRTGNTLSK